jgi:hypothetical protein
MAQDDETRAALWREQQQRRVAFQAKLYAGLAGDPAAHAAFRERWKPLILFLGEREQPAISAQEEFDPLGISDWVNVGL